MWAQIINILLGVAVMILPGLTEFSKAASNSNYIVGPLVITFAMVAIADVARKARFFNILSGIWLIISAFIFSSESGNYYNLILGVLIIIFSIPKGKVDSKFGGGWRSLFQKEPEHIKAAKEVEQTNSHAG